MVVGDCLLVVCLCWDVPGLLQSEMVYRSIMMISNQLSLGYCWAAAYLFLSAPITTDARPLSFG